MIKGVIVSGLLFSLLTLSSIQVLSLDEAVEAYLDGDYDQARQNWRAEADLGDVVAIYNLGMLYFQGLGVPVQPDRAARLFFKAAVMGYAPAQFQLASFHAFGSSSDNSPQSARFWMEVAARQEHAFATYQLGRFLAEGYGGVKDTEQALLMLRRAEGMGVGAAGRYLTELESRLPGIESADDGQLTAKLKAGRGTLKQRREFYEGQKAFISQDYHKAVEYWAPLAEEGMAQAQYGIAFMLESGWGVVQDYAEAAYWYKLSAQKGHRKAQYNLGIMYLDGRGVEENRGIGLFWVQSAADLGESRALNTLQELQGQ